MVKCGLCNNKAVIKVKLGYSKDRRNLCMNHYHYYMNNISGHTEDKPLFQRASNL